MRAKLAALPGVAGVTAATPLPLDPRPSLARYGPEEALTDASKFGQATVHFVQPGYFDVMRTRVADGRGLTEDDNRPGIRNIVVDRVLAARLFPGQSAVGRTILLRITTPEPEKFTVVGVVNNVRQSGPREDVEEMIYFTPNAPGEDTRALTYVIRGPNADLHLDGIRRAVRAIDADLPIASIRTMETIVEESVVQFSFTMLTLAIAAAVALLLGAVGLYSVLSYAVSLRTREIGVRLALGAAPGQVLRSVVGRGVAISAAGLAVGALAAVGLTRLLVSLLFETRPLDPLTFAAMAGLLLLVALAASYLPARRAARISPMESMRA